MEEEKKDVAPAQQPGGDAAAIPVSGQVAELPPADKGTREVVNSLPLEFTPPTEIDEKGREIHRSPSGEIYNPEIHLPSMKITPNGNWRKKRGILPILKRKEEEARAAETIDTEGGELPPCAHEEFPVQGEAIDRAGCRATAETGTFFFLQIGKGIFGEDFKASKDENEHLVSSLETYLVSKGISDIPPGIAVAIAFTGFTVSKLRNDSCREKSRGFFKRLKDKVVLLFAKIAVWRKNRAPANKVDGTPKQQAKGGQAVAQHDTGHNGDWQNDAGAGFISRI